MPLEQLKNDIQGFDKTIRKALRNVEVMDDASRQRWLLVVQAHHDQLLQRLDDFARRGVPTAALERELSAAKLQGDQFVHSLREKATLTRFLEDVQAELQAEREAAGDRSVPPPVTDRGPDCDKAPRGVTIVCSVCNNRHKGKRTP